MKKFKFALWAVLLGLFVACGEKKAETPATTTPDPATTAAPAPAPEVDSVATAIETSTKELENNAAEMKKALDELK